MMSQSDDRSGTPPAEELRLSDEQLRALGYRAVDALVEHLRTLHEQPVLSVLDQPAGGLALGDFPEAPRPPLEVLEELCDAVLEDRARNDHPRFFAFVPGVGNGPSAVAAALLAGLNPFGGTWLEARGATLAELAAADWLRRLCGLPATARGLFVSGGSMANLTALAVARRAKLGEDLDGAVVYFSDQTHSSIPRGLQLLGLPQRACRQLPTDELFRLPLEALQRAVAEDRAAGRRPFCVVANAGTTNSGAVDPLRELAAFCREAGLWLHADAAYGGPAMLVEEGRHLLRGLEEVDSLTVDPHKWLFQPYDSGCVLVRDGALLRDTFRIVPDYLADVDADQERGEVNLCDWGIELTRPSRGVKLWFSLQVFGVRAFREAVARGLKLAEHAERTLRGLRGWEVVTPAQLGVVTFRYAPPGAEAAAADALTAALVDDALADGYAMVASTRLRGRPVLRLCTINPRTTEAEVEETLRRLDAFAAARFSRRE